MEIKPILAITMGDPAGIGAEITIKTLGNSRFYQIARPVVIGDAGLMEKTLTFVDIPLKINKIDNLREAQFGHGIVDVLHIPNNKVDKVEYGKVSKEAGECSVSYIFKGIEMALKREVDGVVTGPINKASMHLAGYKQYAGHTEMFAEKTKTRDYAMLLYVNDLYILHVSTHVPLAEACRRVKKERIAKVIELAHNFIETYNIPNKTIGVAALNPHAGEKGAFGREEIEEIQPAINEARLKGWDVTDPLPPDTVFVRAKKGQYQVIVVMYHDQGHIPVKVIDFERGVNVTVGIPIIRTSVDHGTAFGKAGKGTASSASMEAALSLAARMAAEKFYR